MPHDPATGSGRDWRPGIRAQLTTLSIAPEREAEIVEELAQHLDDRWRELVARGHEPDEAARLARTEFSGARLTTLLGTLQQAHWRQPPAPGPGTAFSLDSLFIDLRQAIRALRATPSFTIGALLVLALGIGATTAIFSVVDAVALRPLPFPDADRIVAVGERNQPRGGLKGVRAMPGAKPPDPDALARIEPQNYLDWVARQRPFESVAAIDDVKEFTLERSGGEPEVVLGHRVTASFFDVLRSRPVLGQPFTTRDEVAGSDRVVVLSHTFWQRRFGGDPSVVGRRLPLNGESYAIAGVMADGFGYPPGAARPAEILVPWVPTEQERVRGRGRSVYLQSIARLRPDVSIAQAQAQMSQVAAAMAASDPARLGGHGIGVRQLRDHLVGSSTRSWMLMLLAAVAIVLLIACANVANLWLARAAAQQREAAVRAALGASRGRLVQRVLIESLALSVAGTLLGLALAWLCVRLLAAGLPESLARVATIGIDVRVLAVAAGAALATGLVSGLVPAWLGSRPALSIVLGESSRGGGAGRGRRRIRAALVVAEVALSVVLLVAAALFGGSFINVMRVDPGFRSEGVLTAQLVPRPAPGSPPIDISAALADIVARARKVPGVVDAAATSGVPLRINMWIDALRWPGQPLDPSMAVSIKVVTPGYHQTLAVPLDRGRLFGEADQAGAEAVVILSESAVRLVAPGADPIGRVVAVGGGERRIVGIVADARQSSLEVSPHPDVYLPMAQSPRSSGFLLLRTTGDPIDALPALRAIVSQVLPREPLRQIARMDDLVAAQTAERRLNMLMFGLFGVLGLTIAAVGLFGVLAYFVSQRTRDIGIRMALGASRARVVGGVATQAGGLVASGLVAGAIAAWWLSTLAGRFLFGIDPRDPRAYVCAVLTLSVAAFAATVLPARRAASIDPTEALREE